MENKTIGVRKVSLLDLDLFKKMLHGGSSPRDIAKITGFYYGTVVKNLRKAGEKMPTKGRFKRKYYLKNENFFDSIDSESKAYFLGLLCADGNVYKNRIKLTLESKDCHIIQTFAEVLETNKPVFRKTYPSHNGCETCHLEIVSEQLVKSLLKLGVTPNKSLTLCFPDIDKNYHSHFIRGYFDGDGRFALSKNRKMQYTCGMFSMLGTRQFLERSQTILMEKCILQKTKLIKTGNIFRLSYGGNKQVKRIVEFMYKNSSIFLVRKYNKIFNLFNNE